MFNSTVVFRVVLYVLFCLLLGATYLNRVQIYHHAPWRLFVGTLRAESPRTTQLERVITAANNSVHDGVEPTDSTLAPLVRFKT
jgi:hypothetical protein